MNQERKTKNILEKKGNHKVLKFKDLSLTLSLLENIVDVWILTDEYLNIQNYHSNFGVSISKNQTLVSLFNEQYQNQFLQFFENFKKHNFITDVSVCFSNSKNTFKVNCTHISEEGINNLFLFTFRDQTQISDLSEKLNNSEEHFRTIVNNTYTWENWINPQGDLIFVNPAVEKYTDYTSDEIIWLFQHPEKYIHKDDFIRVVRKFSKSLREEESGNDIFRITKKDKTIVWMSCSWNPVYSSTGKYLGLRSSLHDVTEIKEAHKLLEANVNELQNLNKKLKEANEKIEEISYSREIFTANMSHLVRTPLNAIFGMTELLYGSNLNKDQIENIDVIENSAENLLTVINDIVDIKKFESQNIIFEKKGIFLYEKMLSLYNILKPEADRKNLNFEFHFPENKQSTIILTDPIRLNQLILNILNNAVKYTFKGSVNFEIKILSETDKKIDVSFNISDTGIGIPEKNTEYIFSGFTKPGTQTVKKIEGNGLGLFICKQLVELMEGEIKVDSAKGRGSTFAVNLSFIKGNKTDISSGKYTSKEIENRKLENVNLLLVEDQEFNQLLIKKITDQWNCKLDIANNGKEAIQMLKSNKYDVVLMDIQLPVMSGLQATQIIRTEFEEPVRSIPIIALTANAIDGDYELYMNSGMNDYIPKPFRSKELYEVITRNLKKRDETNIAKKTSENEIAYENISDKFSLKKILEIARGDKNYVREMILAFINQGLEIKKYFIEALANKNVKELGNNAHKLKSSVSILCLESIENEIIEIVEISRANKHSDKIYDLTEHVVNELEIIIPALQIELKNWAK